MIDREEFARRQAAMTATWFEQVRAREEDVDRYLAQRHAAYMDRWKEAGRFIPDDSRVLDIGGGNLFPQLLEYIKAKRLDYYYLDVDSAVVDGSRKLGESFGLSPDRFSVGFNDQFDFPSDSFDAVFSSHCIEHSFDLEKTLRELNRILKVGGNLLMAVPFGWEENPNHPYFLGPDHWVALVQDAGFDIRVAQVGREYPEQGHDFFIAARKQETETRSGRINPMDWCKESYQFLPPDSEQVVYSEGVSKASDGKGVHLRGNRWTIQISLPTGATEVFPIFMNHEHSGQIEIRCLQSANFLDLFSQSFHDLFSWFPYIQPVRHATPNNTEPSSLYILIRPIGKNPASRSSEGVFYGLMHR